MRGGAGSSQTEQPWRDSAVPGKTSKDKGQAILRDGRRAHTQFSDRNFTYIPAAAKPAGEFASSRIKLHGEKEAPCLCWTQESRRAARRLMANISNDQASVNI